MKHIRKNIADQPRSLTEIQSTPGASFDDCNKEDIRSSLLKEQGYLCAYCMRRIDEGYDKRGRPKTVIEHYIPQSENEALSLNFINMLGVCDGNERYPRHLRHCDRSRKNIRLTIDPRSKRCELLIKYTNGGEIYSEAPKVDRDLNHTLNLNRPRYLTDGRKIAMDQARLSLKNWSEGEIKKAIKKWRALNEKGRLPEFCQAAIYYLTKKLRSR